jgi:hypothetical protein
LLSPVKRPKSQRETCERRIRILRTAQDEQTEFPILRRQNRKGEKGHGIKNPGGHQLSSAHLLRRYGAAGVVPPYGVDEPPDAGAAAAAPEEVVAGGLDEELVLAGRDGRRDERLRVRHVAVGGGVGEPGADGAVDAEDEEDEDERGEELQRRRAPVAPGERHVLAQQGAVLLPRQRGAAEELHRGRQRRWVLGRTVVVLVHGGVGCSLGIYKGGTFENGRR